MKTANHIALAAVAAKHSDFFIASFEELLGKGTEEQKAFSAMREKVHAAVSAVIHKGKTKDDTGYRFQALLSEMQKLGVDDVIGKLLGLLSRPGANHQKDGHQKAKANQL